MSAPNTPPRALALYPDWPDVRCADCARVYRQVPSGITRACPDCGGGKFNTCVTTSPRAVVSVGGGKEELLGGDA